MSLRKTVLDTIESCFREDGVEFSVEFMTMPIMEIGADSLTFAIIVARLERDLSLDPFTANPSLPYPETLEEFIRAYEDAAE